MSLLAALALCVPTAQAQNWSALTYNVQFRPLSAEFQPDNPGANEDAYAMEDHTRGVAIGNAIRGLGDRPDVGHLPNIIAFQEVFREKGYEAMKDTLGTGADGYPNRTLFDQGTLLNYGSGLAIFTRPGFEFQDLGSVDGDLRCLTEDPDHCGVIFHPYSVWEELFSGEKAAYKGVAYARIRNPETGRLLHLFVTHLHAGSFEGEHDADVVLCGGSEDVDQSRASCARAQQIEELYAFVQEQVRNDDLSADVLLMGDLNIQGARNADANVTFPMDSDAVATEWKLHFLDGRFADLGLLDPRLRQSAADPLATINGITNTVSPSNSFSRLDYVLLRSADLKEGPVTCPMHHIEPSDFETTADDQSTRDLSDHFPLLSIFGTEAEGCAPAEATPGQDTFEDTTPSDHNVRWFTFPPGTWTFEAEQDGAFAPVSVYAVTDQSTPLEAVGQRTAVGDPKVVVPVFDALGDLLVRVEVPEGGVPYQVRARENRGSSFEDAIFLAPGEVAGGSTVASTHYQVELRPLTSGRNQEVQFNLFCAQNVSATVGVFDENQQPLTSVFLPPGSHTVTLPASPSSPLDPQQEKLFFVAACAFGQPVTSANYQTNRRTARLSELEVVSQGDLFNLNDEELDLDIYVDGEYFDLAGVLGLAGDPDFSLDIGETAGLGGIELNFDDTIKVYLTEVDAAGDEEFSNSVTTSLIPGTAGAFRSHQLEFGDAASNPGVFESEGGYQLRLDLSY